MVPARRLYVPVNIVPLAAILLHQNRSSERTKIMKTIVAAAALNSVVALGLIAIAVPVHAAVPCEDMLKDMRAAKASAKLSDADMKKVEELETKAVERCNADDDTRADKFLTEAMQIIGK